MGDDKPITGPTAGNAESAAGSESGAALSGSEGGAPPESHENLPLEMKKVVETHMLSMHGVGPAAHPLADKLNDEHISKILDIAKRNNDLARKDRKESRWFAMFCVAGAVAFLVFLTMYLAKSHAEVYEELLETIIALLGGFGGGFGLKSYLDKREMR